MKKEREKPKVGRGKWRREIVSPCENQFMAVKMSVQARVVLHESNWTGISFTANGHMVEWNVIQREREKKNQMRERVKKITNMRERKKST